MDSQSRASRMKLQGPRPAPLMVSKSSTGKMKKQYSSPVVVYLRSPKVFHARPEEFMSLVQHLTGNSNPPSSTSSPFSCDNKLHRPELEEDPIDQITHLERFKLNSTPGPATSLSTDFQALMRFVDFV